MIGFDLEFVIPEKQGFPSSPEARIYVKKVSGGITREGDRQCVTPKCINLTEINTNIDQIISDIEAVRTKAKMAFQKATGL